MPKGGRQSLMPGGRIASIFTLVLVILLMLSFVHLLLLALEFFSLPINTYDAPKAVDLSSFFHKTVDKFGDGGVHGK